MRTKKEIKQALYHFENEMLELKNRERTFSSFDRPDDKEIELHFHHKYLMNEKIILLKWVLGETF